MIIPMPSYYDVGTASVANGDTTITFTGALVGSPLSPNFLPNDLFMDPAQPDVPPQRMASIDYDAATAELAVPWPGTTMTSADYEVRYIGDIIRSTAQTRRYLEMLGQLAALGIQPNAFGEFSDRDAYDDQPKGFIFLSLNGDAGATTTSWTLYIKLSGDTADWDAGGVVQGPAGVGAGGYGLPPSGATGYALVKKTAADGDTEWVARREVLTANRTYYVGYDMGSAAISIASPGVVTKTAHGLAAGARVSFAILENKKTAAISLANPAVVTMANSFAAGQPIKFSSTGRLPPGIVAGQTYYVLVAGLSASSFQFSATPGGAAISTASAPSFTVTIASPGVFTQVAHGLSVGMPVRFATTGALPTGLTAGTIYYVKTVPSADTFTVAATPEGTAINTSGSQSGTHTLTDFGTVYVAEAGTLPTGITAGQEYYVLAAGLTANSFRVSATDGGAAVNTSGSTEGTIAMRTGSDSNNGLANSPSGAFLTVAAAIDVVAALDMGIYNVTIQVARGQYNARIEAKQLLGSGTVTIVGDNTTPSNVVIVSSTRGGIVVDGVRGYVIGGFKINTTGGFQNHIHVANGGVLNIRDQKFELGAKQSTAYYINAEGPGAMLNGIGANFLLSGPGGGGGFVERGSLQALCDLRNAVWAMTDMATVGSYWAVGQSQGQGAFGGQTFDGYFLGLRYVIQQLAIVSSNGGGASFFPGASAGSAQTGSIYG
jgi:hypothetical protein